MVTTRKTQVAVIGAGPGGYAAAFMCADLGMEVTLINAEARPGGVCLNRGCIPSKALLHVAKLINETREAAHIGLTFAEPKLDLARLRQWKNDEVVGKLAGGIGALAAARKVAYCNARATFIDSGSLKLTPSAEAAGKDIPEVLEFQHAILASGSLPVVPKPFQISDPRVMDSTGALALADIPAKLLVIGGGYIGLEMGSVYAALGSKVTVVEMLDGLLPGADRDLVRPLAKRLETQFEKIYLSTKVESLKAEKDGIKVTLSGAASGEHLFDRVLVSIGRRPNSEGLGLENTKVQIDAKGFVKIDRKQRTDAPRILAIGDVAGEPMLAHKANREAKVAAEVLAGHPAEFDSVAIPAVVFTDPELAWCGLTENDAKKAGREVKIARFPWSASGRATTLGRNEGLTKILFDPKTERVLGVGMVGVGVGDMIAEGVLAVELAATARDLAESIHPHPTLSETVMEAAELLWGQATHMIGKAR
jgi:dihydrolipoamide dehydrogenase